MSKTLLIIIVIIAAIAGFWLWNSNKSEEGLGPIPNTQGLPQLPPVSNGDTTTQIQEDLNKIDLGDIEQQFKNIDADLNSL